jgi:NADH:ubiquinone oxidoreductase subunit 6 (subunit J)
MFIYNFNLLYFDNFLIYSNWILFNNIKIVSIGQLLFNELYIYFFGASLLLFVAMIGAILLTLQNRDLKILKKRKMPTFNIN